MYLPPSVFRAFSLTAGAGVLAISISLSAAGSVHAESPTSSLGATVQALPDVQRKPEPKPPPAPSSPALPTPAPPEPPPPAAPAPVPSLAPEPGVVETPSAEATGSTPAVTPSTAGPSTESNWNKPIPTSAQPTQAASSGDGPDSGNGGPLPIIAGLLLLGLGGLSITWWGRNRYSSH